MALHIAGSRLWDSLLVAFGGDLSICEGSAAGITCTECNETGGFVSMTKMDIFIEEVGKQSEYVLMAAVQLDKALKEHDPKNAFFYIQALLTASANVSKLLWGVDRNAKARQERQGLR